MLMVSGSPKAECPNIDEAMLIDAEKRIDAARATNFSNVAIGEGASAQTNSININKNTEIHRSSVINQAGSQSTTRSLNVSIGKGSTANSGAIDLQ